MSPDWRRRSKARLIRVQTRSDRYADARRIDVGTRTAAVDLMNRSLLSDFLPVQLARSAGLYVLGRVAGLRRFAMREGLALASTRQWVSDSVSSAGRNHAPNLTRPGLSGRRGAKNGAGAPRRVMWTARLAVGDGGGCIATGPSATFSEYLGLRLVGCLVRLLPLGGSDGVAWSWRVVAPRLSRQPRALAHLALAYPEKSESERIHIASDMWASLGRTFAESFVIDKIMRGDRIDDRAAASLLTELKPAHRGFVFVSLHTGNWELAIVPAVTAGIKTAGIYQRVKNPWVDRYLTRTRRERYPRGLFAKGSDIALN